jgi:putative transcriptional regulator
MKPARIFKLRGEPNKSPFQYKECGLDDVYLLNGYEPRKSPYGEGVSIKHQDALHDAIGLHLASERKVLAGREIRYLRSHMQMTQSDLGKRLGYSAQQVARWEKDQSEMPGAADRLLRVIYLERMKRSPKVEALLTKLEEMDDAASPRQYFKSAGSGWKIAVALR